MEYGAIDLHTKESEIRIVEAGGAVVFERRITTTRDRLTGVFSGRAPMRILVESSGGSEWVAQHLEGLGHEVVAADPNYTLMYGARRGRVKTDRRDVAARAEANRHGLYRRAHRLSGGQQLGHHALESFRRRSPSHTVDVGTTVAATSRANLRGVHSDTPNPINNA